MESVIMFILEAENHDKGVRQYVSAENKEEMHDNLIQLGFCPVMKYSLYVGFNERGEEVSVMDSIVPHVSKLSHVTKEPK